jgi:DNA-directed RNA polymerase specialized sigma24 family protein
MRRLAQPFRAASLPRTPNRYSRHVRPHNVGIGRRRPARADGADLESAELPVPPEVEGLAAGDDLRRALAHVAPDRAEALLLHHVWGFTFEEIGKMLGIRPGAARVRASRAMRVLRGLLK